MKERDKIVEYSKEKFISEGFYKITMDEIAAGLRMSKKTIYKFFPSKDMLVNAAVNLFKSIVQKKLDDITTGKSNSILKIKKISNLIGEISLKISPKMMEDLRTHRPELWQNIDEFRTKNFRRIWAEIFDQGKQEGYINDYPNEIMIEVIIGSMQVIINPTFILNHNLSINQAFEIAFGMLINGILTEKGKKVYKNLEKENE